MDIEIKIKEIKENLEQVDDASVLTDWDSYLSGEFAWLATELANVKRDRATQELGIKKGLIESGKKYTEKEIERQYFSTDQGKFYAYSTEMLKALGKLISAVRFKRKMMTEPLS